LFNRLVKEVSTKFIKRTNSGHNIVLEVIFLLNVELIIGVIVTVALMSVIIASLIGTLYRYC
jgi:magnesium transporter